MLTRTTLNARQPRTLRDTGRDPWDWCEHAHRASPLSRWARPLSWLVTLGLFAAIGVLLAWRG